MVPFFEAVHEVWIVDRDQSSEQQTAVNRSLAVISTKIPKLTFGKSLVFCCMVVLDLIL